MKKDSEMKFVINYTPELPNLKSPYANLHYALIERPDNTDSILSDEKRLIVENLKKNKDHFFNFTQVQLLKELALEVKKRWVNNSKLNVYFFNPSDNMKKAVLEKANEWSKHCSIKFKETKDRKKADIRVSFDLNDGCWSFIGTDAKLISKNEATLNLGIDDTYIGDKEFDRLVLHEFGHALGLIHEHQSPLVDIEWNKSYIYNDYQLKYKWNKNEVDHNLFKEYSKNETNHSSVVDRDSIMAYYIPSHYTKNGVSFPHNCRLSKIDIQTISKFYHKGNQK